MNSSDLITLVSKALYLALMLSLPTILVTSVIGLLFAVLQALTQIQEQTLAFAVKLIVSFGVLALTIRWMGSETLQFTRQLFDMIAIVGR